MGDLKIIPAAVTAALLFVCAVAVLTSVYRQDCLEAGYPYFTGQLWDPYCVRKGPLGQDETRRLADLKEP